ncbi:MAG: hydrogenase maturation protease [Gammaproteobacteria bacterium]|uniref:hydrogenase maturation protease n=1 Tax=Rhodoferax sp. TaxID=50421 RepID=UPI00182C71EB|nr:hydrogenase maturation protease [Rhodoferax sp.]MBU3900517.1 hydrogenase maturation protease [Gammaproteobacteria bacterium]MBA3057578.1 hydrogenase maturation protease [Rhodoferax sp.]MBU3996422.1 hydrogenase maturation protease [Gammaproteobacteria bacterium]MBU4079962.1 hydrogenase maturation protease [Gammaproteobacteria bacterium]MBU4113418.1 hydrogenase maturation protease [Gammaproteobacteria bacterium]
MRARPTPVAPLLVFGWGNLSRGDDALGPLLIERLRVLAAPGLSVDYLDDYQLQIEHALDLVGRQRVLFVDASLSCLAPFEVTKLRAAPDSSFTSHALSPPALLQVFCNLRSEAPPPCTLLAIRGERFELGAPPSAAALAHLAAALAWAADWLAAPVAEPKPCSSNGVDSPQASATMRMATPLSTALPDSGSRT